MIPPHQTQRPPQTTTAGFLEQLWGCSGCQGHNAPYHSCGQRKIITSQVICQLEGGGVQPKCQKKEKAFNKDYSLVYTCHSMSSSHRQWKWAAEGAGRKTTCERPLLVPSTAAVDRTRSGTPSFPPPAHGCSWRPDEGEWTQAIKSSLHECILLKHNMCKILYIWIMFKPRGHLSFVLCIPYSKAGSEWGRPPLCAAETASPAPPWLPDGPQSTYAAPCRCAWPSAGWRKSRHHSAAPPGPQGSGSQVC